MEHWRCVDEFPNYEVSNLGRLRRSRQSAAYWNAQPGQVVQLHLMNRYLKYGFHVGGKRVTRAIHRLVAGSFIPNPLGLPQVNHKDGDKRNNRVENLEWCTGEENVRHAKEVLNAYRRAA